MNKSVELLLQRMKDHPKEFLVERASAVTDYSARECRFGNIVSQILARKYPSGHDLINGKPVSHLEFFSDEEVEQLYRGLLDICEENFYSIIVDELANSTWEKRIELDKREMQARMGQHMYHPAQNMNVGQRGLVSGGAYVTPSQGQGLLSSLFGGGK